MTKCRKIADVINSILLWRNPSYNLKAVTHIADFLEKAAGFDDVTSYRLSHMLEPQDVTKPAEDSDEEEAPRGILRKAAESTLHPSLSA